MSEERAERRERNGEYLIELDPTGRLCNFLINTGLHDWLVEEYGTASFYCGQPAVYGELRDAESYFYCSKHKPMLKRFTH